MHKMSKNEAFTWTEHGSCTQTENLKVKSVIL